MRGTFVGGIESFRRNYTLVTRLVEPGDRKDTVLGREILVGNTGTLAFQIRLVLTNLGFDL